MRPRDSSSWPHDALYLLAINRSPDSKSHEFCDLAHSWLKRCGESLWFYLHTPLKQRGTSKIDTRYNDIYCIHLLASFLIGMIVSRDGGNYKPNPPFSIYSLIKGAFLCFKSFWTSTWLESGPPPMNIKSS